MHQSGMTVVYLHWDPDPLYADDFPEFDQERTWMKENLPSFQVIEYQAEALVCVTCILDNATYKRYCDRFEYVYEDYDKGVGDRAVLKYKVDNKLIHYS